MLREYMSELGYTEDYINKILNTSPVNQYVEYTLCVKVKEIFGYFLEFGYKSEEIIELTLRNPIIFWTDFDRI